MTERSLPMYAFWLKDTSLFTNSFSCIETSASVYRGALKFVIPLTSKANDDEMSLLMATELVPEPSFTFRLRDMSEPNAVDPLNVIVDPLSVSAPAAEMSTVVPVLLFTILIASVLPMVMVPVEPDPSMIFTLPFVCTPLAKAIWMLSIATLSNGMRPTQNVPFPWSFSLRDPPARYVSPLCVPI